MVIGIFAWFTCILLQVHLSIAFNLQCTYDTICKYSKIIGNDNSLKRFFFTERLRREYTCCYRGKACQMIKSTLSLI